MFTVLLAPVPQHQRATQRLTNSIWKTIKTQLSWTPALLGFGVNFPSRSNHWRPTILKMVKCPWAWKMIKVYVISNINSYQLMVYRWIAVYISLRLYWKVLINIKRKHKKVSKLFGTVWFCFYIIFFFICTYENKHFELFPSSLSLMFGWTEWKGALGWSSPSFQSSFTFPFLSFLSLHYSDPVL